MKRPVVFVPWQTGVAEVVGVTGRFVKVSCPHCGQTHQHARTLIGGNHVVAGCHTGWSRCREYRIVDLGANRQRSRAAA